ncbi:MAG: glutathione peroxidase [Chitinophagaceae bacterium]|nr:glutathione peroxidase [Chitinophagaceae bacterium]
MTPRQSFIKTLYPTIMTISGWFKGSKDFRENKEQAKPLQSIFDLSFTSITNEEIALKAFAGKQLLLVNTASDCGFTPQLKELQLLHDRYKDTLVVIGFPSNDFKEQETGSNSEIDSFCKVNYGVEFLLSNKVVVRHTEGQHPVFQWLTQSSKNGWNPHEPSWNFTKYLVNADGILIHVFGPTVGPLSNKLISKL